MSEMLSDSTVTENNMMQFLGVIEQRTNEIIQSLAALAQSTAPAAVPPTASRVFVSKRGISPVPSDSLSNGAALVSLLGHGPATQHGSDVMAAVDPPKVDDASSVRLAGAYQNLFACLCCAMSLVWVCGGVSGRQ
jgi:hypothetical protein